MRIICKYVFILHIRTNQFCIDVCCVCCLLIAAFTRFVQKLFYCLPQDNLHSVTD